MKVSIDKQHAKRKAAIQKLNNYLENPGRFSILILGKTGTGKTFWLEQFAEKKGIEVIMVKGRLTEETKDYWAHILKKAHQKVLLIKDVEYLSKKSQELLFEGLSTKDGKFGLAEKEYEVRIVFSSSKPIANLRDSRQYLSNHFFDRIAQLVVEFPSFDSCSAKIVEDFKVSWKKFGFKKAPYPKVLEDFLKEKGHSLNGNFRDLDKLCISWDQSYRDVLAEKEVDDKHLAQEVIAGFKKYNHFPESKETGIYEFSIEDKSADELIKNFKAKLKYWAVEKYGTLQKAGEALGMSYRTLERW